jgi:hypothetical protein
MSVKEDTKVRRNVPCLVMEDQDLTRCSQVESFSPFTICPFPSLLSFIINSNKQFLYQRNSSFLISDLDLSLRGAPLACVHFLTLGIFICICLGLDSPSKQRDLGTFDPSAWGNSRAETFIIPVDMAPVEFNTRSANPSEF